jgi:hypothetical protein
MQFLYSVCYELTASACFEYYLLIFRRRYIINNWYIACVLCLLAAARVEVEHFKLGSSKLTQYAHNMPIVVYETPPEDEKLVLEICKVR